MNTHIATVHPPTMNKMNNRGVCGVYCSDQLIISLTLLYGVHDGCSNKMGDDMCMVCYQWHKQARPHVTCPRIQL